VGVLTAPDNVNPFGQVVTDTGDISGLFTDVLVDAGSDGQKDRDDSYELTLRNADGTLVGIPVGDFEAAEGVATTLKVTFELTNALALEGCLGAHAPAWRGAGGGCCSRRWRSDSSAAASRFSRAVMSSR